MSENRLKRIATVTKRAKFIIVLILILMLAAGPGLAATNEALATAEAATKNYLQEVDVVFWQTLPFAALWGHFLERQLSSVAFPGSAAHWDVIMVFATAVSATNALIQARRAVENERTGNRN
ncbi:MAG: hypothetical protein KJ732_01435 [Candidatus Margulisbacteria bacterium]|nr:hypothetical protein [Candidatus Margulisiibacteriota bacterium]